MEQQLQETRYDKVIDLTQERFKKVAAPSIKFESEKGFAVQLLQSKPELMNAALSCPESLAAAIINIAAIGLSLNPAKKQAYLITRSVKVKGNDGRDFWQSRIFLEPSYIGLCDLATLTGSMQWVQAKPVHEKDTYVNNGIDKEPTHVYESFRDRGPIVGFVCIAKTRAGEYLTTEMSMAEIEKVRASSESFKKGFGPWKDWFEEQAKKTVIRRASKTWPKTDQFDRIEQAIHLSNENEGFEPILSAPALSNYNAEQKAYFDGLITNSDALGMFVLQCTMDESMFTNLYNSFEKGSVTKYKRIVGDLLSKGASIVEDCATAIMEGIEQGDDSAIAEIVDGMSSDAINILRERLPQNMKTTFDAAVKAA